MAGEVILLVEDNANLLSELSELLEKEEYHVIPAVHGRDGLEKMKLDTPDLIISDIIMPIMDGYQFFQEVRSKPDWVSIPFIFLTAHKDFDYVLKGKKLGVEDFLYKPILAEELITAVRSRLSRSQQLLMSQLQLSYEASLIMLANAIEVRDQYTRGHVERVMNYSLILAEQLGYGSSELRDLRFGSILHDIGKIQIRESLLLKKEPLTESETDLIRKHPIMGVDLIKGIHYLLPAIPVILNHHERWDGSGYPKGLVGDAIPLSARIVAVADSFDAMTSKRPYRPMMSVEKAYEEILRNSGTLYDPKVVREFERAWVQGRIDAIYKAFPS